MTAARRGFTLVEMIAVIAILGTLAAAGSGLIFTASNAYADASIVAELHDEASASLDQCVRILRDIPEDAAASGPAPDIDVIVPYGLRWDANTILYRSGTNLWYREGLGTWRIVQTDVTAFVVRSYDNDAALLAGTLVGAACDPIRRIEIELTVTRLGVSETVRTRVYLRCTMDEATA